jgi:hypothetical protein
MNRVAWGWLLCVAGSGCVIDVTPVTPDGGTGDSGGDDSPGGADRLTESTPDDVNVPGAWVNVTANLANMASECGNISTVSAKPDEDLLITAVALHGLWATSDGGGSWHPIGVGSDASATIDHRLSSIAYDPKDPSRYWESGIYGSAGGVYETRDDGNTFVQLGTVTHCDFVSVDWSDPQRLTLLAGGHEQSQTVYRSNDAGMTWSNIGAGLPPNSVCTYPLVIDSQTYVLGCGPYANSTPGIYRSIDGGSNWTMVTRSGGAGAPLVASDGSIYWAGPNGAGMTKSSDGGQTWNDVVGAGIIDGVTPIELPDKRLATLGRSSAGRFVKLSQDQGATWRVASPPLPYEAVGLVYSKQQKAFFVWHSTCGGGSVPVPPDAIMRFDFDYQKN